MKMIVVVYSCGMLARKFFHMSEALQYAKCLKDKGHSLQDIKIIEGDQYEIEEHEETVKSIRLKQ